MSQTKWYGKKWWYSGRVWVMVYFWALTIGSGYRSALGIYGIGTPVFLGAASVLLACFNARYLCYFGITYTALIVRNHLRFWWRKSYLLSELKSIRLEVGTTKVDSDEIRIFITPASYKRYYAATLTDRSWNLFEDLLEGKGIRVVNCI